MNTLRSGKGTTRIYCAKRIGRWVELSQTLLRYTSEARFLRYAHAHLRPWLPYLPSRSAYNKRLRGLVADICRLLTERGDTVGYHTARDLWMLRPRAAASRLR